MPEKQVMLLIKGIEATNPVIQRLSTKFSQIIPLKRIMHQRHLLHLLQVQQ